MDKSGRCLLAIGLLAGIAGCYDENGGGGFDVGTDAMQSDDGSIPDGGMSTPQDLSSVHSVGLTAPTGACGNLGGDASTTKLRFAMVGDEGRAMRPANKGGSLESGAPEVSYTDGGAIYEHPDLVCGNAGPKPPGDERSYKTAVLPYDGSCSDGYRCSVGVSDGSDAMKRCRRQSNYSVDGVAHVADVDGDQVFAVLVENAGSLEGFPPGETRNWYYDADGDGQAEREVQRRTGSDEASHRVTALQSLVANWEDVRTAADSEGRQTFFGLWTFAGQAGPTSIVAEASSSETTSTPKSVLDAYPMRTEPGTRGNVLESMQSLLENQYAGARFDGMDKTLVVVTDGPPERHPDRHGVTVDDVIQTAKEVNVRIFMVHLDAPVNDGSPEALLDDPAYYQAQKDECSSDGNCQSHEHCREVRGYHPSQGGDVSGTRGIYRDGTFCMPQRRADGRTGPLAIYARIACATQGGYQYVKTPRELGWAMSWLPYTMDGLWEADVTVQELGRGNATPNAPIRLQTGFTVKASGTEVPLDLSQVGGDRDANAAGSGDSRSVVVTGDQ